MCTEDAHNMACGGLDIVHVCVFVCVRYTCECSTCARVSGCTQDTGSASDTRRQVHIIIIIMIVTINGIVVVVVVIIIIVSLSILSGN